ncbi:hypothetical protein HJG60_003474 [Phyllostomus discolor]|uniref:Uncharacterized protein n=1 Tax=Phyllostomus discolor TaxID=89673 RepID=A0A834EE08_9CHIR|nr:hypothetical protein HJG60_003474 [Phyllostomus discolor]
MTCAKCNHGFCWRCLKPWKPSHKDYYNCSAMVSKAARQEKRFQDYNERCTFHHQARVRRGRDGSVGRSEGGWVRSRWGHVCTCSAEPLSSVQEFAVNLWNRVSALHEVPPPKSFTFLSNACRGLEQARKVVVGGGGDRWSKGV